MNLLFICLVLIILSGCGSAKDLPKSSLLPSVKYKNKYIELKDSPLFRVTPITLFEFDYSSHEDVYEEMDELLKLKRKSSLNNNDNGNIKRGDIDPTLDYSLLEDKIDEKVPVRGDIVTRNKRSHNDYYNDNDDDDDYYYYYDYNNDNNLWGFGENDGLNLLINKDDYDDHLNEFKNKVTTKQLKEEELENKLRDYIARNRPISLKNGKINQENYNKVPVTAKIIIDTNKPVSFQSRNDFQRDVDFPEINPTHKGIKVNNFPTASRRGKSSNSGVSPPGVCVWAIVQCCPRSSSTKQTEESVVDRQVINCFEYMACPGVANWNPSLCNGAITNDARKQILKYYSSSQ